MSLSTIISHTPLWVWLLLGFVVSRGVNALRPRELAPSRVILVPAIFLVWGLSGLIGGAGGFVLPLGLFVVAMAAGLFVGRGLAQLSPAPHIIPGNGRLAMPGSPIPLVMIVLAFAIKYVGAVALAVIDEPLLHGQIAWLMTVVGGLFAGMFWGRTLFQFQRALHAAGAPADLAAIANLALGRAGPRR